MKITERTMMEQELYGINEDINLINGDDFIIESVSEYLDAENPDYTLMDSLHESIQYSNYFSVYTPLLEAADGIKNVEKDLETIKETRDPNKFKAAMKKIAEYAEKLADWFIRIDPEKKGKVWSKIVNKLLHISAVIILALTAFNFVTFAAPTVFTKMPMTKFSLSDSWLSFIFGMTGYLTIYKAVLKIFESLNKALLKKSVEINLSDYENSLEQWEEQINKLDDVISKLEKEKEQVENESDKKKIDKQINEVKKSQTKYRTAIKDMYHLMRAAKINKIGIPVPGIKRVIESASDVD